MLCLGTIYARTSSVLPRVSTELREYGVSAGQRQDGIK